MNDMNTLIAQMREEYETEGIDPSTLGEDPFDVFGEWFRAAHKAGLPQPNAVSLATVASDGRPSVRSVLLKGFDHRGFVFYTNLSSRKGRELDGQGVAAMAFTWLELHRQVRIEGSVGRVDQAEADEYFATRPRGAQLAAAASHQSDRIEGRDQLERAVAELEERYPDAVPRPAHWGGYRLEALAFEFWQGRPSRMHDRVLYTPDEGGGWDRVRLSP